MWYNVMIGIWNSTYIEEGLDGWVYPYFILFDLAR